MITLDILCARFTSLNPDDLRRWIAEGHVRTDRAADDLVFTEIDVERVRLILELRDPMQVNEEALPIVLSLLDQIYELHRRMRALGVEPDGSMSLSATPQADDDRFDSGQKSRGKIASRSGSIETSLNVSLSAHALPSRHWTCRVFMPL